MILGQFQFRRDTAANWTSNNPILLSGEMGIESDTQKFKIGNGTANWNSLAYGGIQGPQGATGATGAAGSNGWSPILANVTDGERRVLRLVDWTGGTGTKPPVPTDNYIGPTGFTNLAGATDIRGATGAQGAQGPAGATQNTFGTIAVAGQNNVVADASNDTLTLVAGTNITLLTNDATDSITINSTSVATNAFGIVTGNTGTATADAPTDTLAITGGTGISTAATDTPDGLVITNTDTGSAARTAHEAAADPHPQYTTTAEASAAAPVQSVNAGTGISVNQTTGAVTVSNAGVTSVNGQSGAVTVPPGKAATTLVTDNATTTAETVVARWAIPANTIEANDGFQIKVAHQSGGTATLIYRLRIGALGTIADTLLAQCTTSAAQVANARGTYNGAVFFPSTTQARGQGFAIQQAAVLGTVTGAAPTATIVPANTVFISVTVQSSAANAHVTQAAVGSWGDQ